MLVGGGGVQDALASLGAHPDDWVLKCALIRAAAQLQSEQRNAEIKAMAALVGNRVGEIMVKAFSQMFK